MSPRSAPAETPSSSANRPADLREACVAEALAIIGQSGVESLSLREVARRLGVSHQAPYKHFASREHILAEIMRRAFDEFAAALDAHQTGADPAGDALAMGVAYVEFALARPLHYRLMFGGAQPDPAAHPDMMRSARHAFSLLHKNIGRVFAARGAQLSAGDVELEALFAWSSLHGVVSLLRSGALATLHLEPDTCARQPAHVLDRIGAALGLAPPAGGALTKEIQCPPL